MIHVNGKPMRVVGVIPARYRSSRFPGKPLIDILGHPMIWWVYEQCKKVEELDDICVATDDERIETACRQNCMNVMMTSEGHPTGSDRVAEVARKIPGQLFVNIQGDEPVIEPEMIRQVINIFCDPNVYFGTLKKEISDLKQIQAASTVKVVTDVFGDALYFSRSIIPSNIKDGILEKTYRHVGIYGYRKDFLLRFAEMPQPALELGEAIEPLRAMYNGYKIRVRETEYESIGVDLPEHIELVKQKIVQERRIL